MTPQELAIVQATPASFPLLTSAYLVDKTPRTLLYGHFQEGPKLHVYLDASGEIHRHCYLLPKVPGQPVLTLDQSFGPAGGTHTNQMLAPTGLGSVTYPEHSDFEFTILLKHAGITLCFAPCPELSVAADTHEEVPDHLSTFAGLSQAGGSVRLEHIVRRFRRAISLSSAHLRENLDIRMLSVACHNLGVASYHAKKDGTFLVDRDRSEEVLAECIRLAGTLPKDWQDFDSDSALCLVYFAAFRNNSRLDVSFEGGAARGLTYSRDGGYPARALTAIPRLPEYGAAEYPKAFSGIWEEQPFAVVVQESTRIGRLGAVEQDMYEIQLHLSLFGAKEHDQAQFLAQNGFG